MLTKSDPETALLRDAVSGARFGVPLALTESVSVVAVNGDGSRILTGNYGGTAWQQRRARLNELEGPPQG